MLRSFLAAAVAAVALVAAQPARACDDCKNCPHHQGAVAQAAEKKDGAEVKPACACAGEGKECKCGEKCQCAHCSAHRAAAEKKPEPKKS
jgi:hypothetical protein